MTIVNLSTVTGKATHPDEGTASFMIIAAKQRVQGAPPNDDPDYLSKSMAGVDLIVVQPSDSFPVTKHNPSPGRIFRSDWAVDATQMTGLLTLIGTKVVASRSLRQSAAMIIRPRAAAPLVRVKSRLITVPNAAATHGEVMGRFDIIPLAEAERDHNIYIRPIYRRLYTRQSVNAMMQITEIDSGQVAPVLATHTVINSDGEEKAIKVRSRRRRMRVD